MQDYIETAGASCVFGFAIQLYSYVSIVPNSAITPSKFRLSYSQVENVDSVDDIAHPIIRETLRFKDTLGGFHLVSISDIPAGTGMGTSSAFTVSLVSALDALEGRDRSQTAVAGESVHIERNLVGDAGGIQDQYWAACGGAGLMTFTKGGFSISPASQAFANVVEERGLLFSLGATRSSHDEARKANTLSDAELANSRAQLSSQAQRMGKKLSRTHSESAVIDCLFSEMKDAWSVKKQMISLSIEAENAIAQLEVICPAIKLLGAGGTGMVFVLPENDSQQQQLLKVGKELGLLSLRPKIDHHGVKRIL